MAAKKKSARKKAASGASAKKSAGGAGRKKAGPKKKAAAGGKPSAGRKKKAAKAAGPADGDLPPDDEAALAAPVEGNDEEADDEADGGFGEDAADLADADQVQEAPVAAAAPARKQRALPPMPPRRADGKIRVAFSPDADDAFMFFGLIDGKVDTEDREYELVRDDIQVLNQKAQEGFYDVTAISFGAWPYVQDRYLLLPCGASFGDGRGPILVARTPIRTHEVHGLTVAVPGRHTTATLALKVWLPHAKLDLKEVPFDEVIPAVRRGDARAGILIHERQLTWREENFVRVVDFGQWWSEKTEGLPLPLGANAIRRDIPDEERQKIALDIKRSIAYGLGHREEALDHALPFAKGLDRKIVDKYVSMYVNELALDFAERGRQAVLAFFGEAQRLGLVPKDTEPEFA